MNAFMKTLLSLSLSGTLVFLLLKLLKPLYREKFSRRWQYYIWLVAALRFLLPFSPDGTLMNRIFTEAEQTVWQGEWQEEWQEKWQEESEGPQDGDASGTGTAGIAGIAGMARPALTAETQGRESGEPVEARPERISGEKSLRISGMLFEIWLAGAAFLFIWKLVSYQRFVQGLRTGSLQALDADTDMQGILASVQRTMGIKKKVRLSRSERLASPVLLGVMRPRLVLPAHELEPKMLPYLFRHELTHVRRRDNLYKWLVQLVICIHWFNPAAHLLGKEVCRACELACDEAIIASLDAKEKRSYGRPVNSETVKPVRDIIQETVTVQIKDPYVVPAGEPEDIVNTVIIGMIESAVFSIRDFHRVVSVTVAVCPVVDVEHRGCLYAHQSVRKHYHVTDIIVGQSA